MSIWEWVSSSAVVERIWTLVNTRFRGELICLQRACIHSLVTEPPVYFQSVIGTVQAPSLACRHIYSGRFKYILWTAKVSLSDALATKVVATLIPLLIIERVASPIQLAQMFKNSFSTRLEQSSNEYRFYLVPGCTLIYRVSMENPGLSSIPLIRPRGVPRGRTIVDWVERTAR